MPEISPEWDNAAVGAKYLANVSSVAVQALSSALCNGLDCFNFVESSHSAIRQR
jgi:hypothetical protein